MQFTLKKSYFIAFCILVSSISILSFQNCSRTQFSTVDQEIESLSLAPQSPFCSPDSRPPESENVQCASPNQNQILAVQPFDVICNDRGQWSRVKRGSADYRLCPESCTGSPLSDTESVPCPGLNSNLLNGVQKYAVKCSQDGRWYREISGTANYAACPALCTGSAPSSSSPIACPAPNTNLLIGVQNYDVKCAADGAWKRTILGAADYTACPKSCSGTNPAVRRAIACPSGMNGTAYQNYSSTCNTTTGQWSTPITTTVDNSGCTVVTCSGSAPTNFDSVSCPSPFQSRLDAKRMYSAASCVNGAWVRGSLTGVVDTSSCPVNDCSGSVDPGAEKDRGLCPAGSTGRIFQTCSLTCTGNTYSQTNCSADNYSRCDCGANATFNVVTRTCVSTLPVCAATAPVYSVDGVNLNRSAALTPSGNSCACAGGLEYDSVNKRCKVSCPTDKVVYQENGVYKCGDCQDATVTGTRSIVSVRGVPVNGACYYPGLSIAEIEGGRCNVSSPFGGWYSGPPSTSNGWHQSGYPTQGPGGYSYTSCQWVSGPNPNTHFLNCKAPALGGACSTGDGSGNPDGFSGGGLSGTPL